MSKTSRAPRSAAFLIALLPLIVTASPAPGQDEDELVTDRPDQTESTAIVAVGRTQLEVGATYTADRARGERSEVLEAPATLVRIGLVDGLELRLGWEGRIDEELHTPGGLRRSADGSGDAEIGAKLRLRPGGGRSPAVAVIVATSVPVGDDDFTSDRFDPAVRVVASHDLASGVGLGWNLGLETASAPAAGGGTTTRTTAIYTLAAGLPAGERWGVFVELFGEVPVSAEGGPVHSFDGGATWLVRPNLQLDVAAGLGLSDDAPDWFAGIGLSLRLPR